MQIATGQASVATSGSLIAAERDDRVAITVVNGGTVDVFLGTAAVTTSGGVLLAGVKGQPLTLRTAAPIYGIVASGSENVSYVEEF